MRFVPNKRPLVKITATSLCIAIGLFLAGCSAEKNTVTSKAFHNLASHYNGYFYAKEEMTKVEERYAKSMTDDYNRILRLYPKLDSTQSAGYDKELKEVVKMASLAIQYHKNSKWVDDSYILVGKARLYALDWPNAIQTFKFVNTNSKDKDARHEAILNLIRAFVEHDEYNNAKAAAAFLQKEELNPQNKKQLYLELAYLAQTQNDLDKMVFNLTQAAPLLQKKADRPGRIYFIIGQVYQKLGFEAQAYNYYRKCLSTHPEYEVDFYARLYSAQVTEISRSRDINTARKSFKRLLKDSKNRDFKDKIYYEMGLFERKQGNIDQGVNYLNQAIRIGNNKRVDGEAYLRLGEMNYERKQYELSQAYYDSAVKTLPVDYEDIAGIKKRQEILDEFVQHLTTIRWQDSLLVMSQMDSAALRLQVEASVKASLKPEPTGRKKKKANRITIEQAPTSIFATPTNDEATENSTWYFANATAVALGQTEFNRIWGNIALEDNWRLSQRSTNRTQTPSSEVASTDTNDETTEPTNNVANAVEAALSKIKSQLLDTDEKKAESLKKIEEAYYMLGDIYSLKLGEPANAIETYNTLLKRFPESDYKAEVLYRLYILTKESNPDQANAFANILKKDFPESSWTKILINPDYLTEAGKVAVRQKALYAQAYDFYTKSNYDSASMILKQAQSLGLSTFTPNLELLEALIIGKTKGTTVYKEKLQAFIETYPEHELKTYAAKLLEAAEKKSPSETSAAAVSYDKNLTGNHSFVIVYTQQAGIEEALQNALRAFNKQHYPQQNFNSNTTPLLTDKNIFVLSGISDDSAAKAYINLFNEKLATMNALKNYNFNNFVISEANLETLKRTQALHEYLIFYKQHYQTENQ
jgi:tetratricopeptide (TPR) repeat protein